MMEDFLRCPTPDAWFEQAAADVDTLLIDHANCEKKAASTALGLFRHYLDLARRYAPEDVTAKLDELLVLDAELVTETDDALRFHSGPLAPDGPLSR